MPALMRARSTEEILTIFDDERHAYGWATAKETITRIAKRSAKGGASSTSSINADARFLALLDIPATAIEQGVMDSKTRLNYQSDDLTSLQAALTMLRVPREHRLHGLLAGKLEEEREEDDEPGTAGHDFQGGSVGF